MDSIMVDDGVYERFPREAWEAIRAGRPVQLLGTRYVPERAVFVGGPLTGREVPVGTADVSIHLERHPEGFYVRDGASMYRWREDEPKPHPVTHDHPGAAAADRDDLAREAARLWAEYSEDVPYWDSPVPAATGEALDRWADACGFGGTYGLSREG